jgi:hypothetical protein
MVTGITGAITALGDTLFPATSLRSAVLQDFSRGMPVLLRFRVVHPPLAAITACFLLWIIFKTSTQRSRVSQPALALIIAVFAQLGIGMMNVLLLAPVLLQILHLFMADLIWILLVLASADRVLQPANAFAGFPVAKHDWSVEVPAYQDEKDLSHLWKDQGIPIANRGGREFE